jgi:hypothetical protein
MAPSAQASTHHSPTKHPRTPWTPLEAGECDGGPPAQQPPVDQDAQSGRFDGGRSPASVTPTVPY